MDADATRVVQVISNLLNNAAKYTPQGGAARLSVTRDGDEAVIAVSDSGIGIAPAALPLVFDMFTQVGRDAERTQGGLGIGLSLVRRLVELHGGSVTAASAGLGQGSCFTVRLPLARDAAMAAPAPPTPVPATTASLRVLVVDDNTDAAEMIASLIELHGHQASVAHDGVAALAAARTLRPHLIFLDIGLPRRDGYHVAQDIRADASLAGVFLVALTGWGAQDDLRRAAEAGFDRHLTKPVAFDSIVAILAEVAAATDLPR